MTHFPGKSNTIADLLSWRKDFEGGVNPNKDVTLLPENLFISPEIKVNKVYLEDNSETQHKVLQEIHNTPTGGHPGISNT